MTRIGSSSSTAPPMSKGTWSPKEDAQLTAMVEKHGPGQWSMISTGVPGRTGKSCRLRWCSQLSPAVQNRRLAAAAAQFPHTDAVAAASAAAENNLQVQGKGKAVVIDVENYEVDARVKVSNEPPPAKRQRVSTEGGAGSAASGGDADPDAWLTLSLGLPQHQQQPVEEVTRQAPTAPVVTETPAVMAAMREMVREEVERQASQLVAAVFMAARAGNAGNL